MGKAFHIFDLPRTEKVLKLLNEFKTNSEIAVIIKRSKEAAKDEVERILKHYGVKFREHAVRRAKQVGDLPFDQLDVVTSGKCPLCPNCP